MTGCAAVGLALLPAYWVARSVFLEGNSVSTHYVWRLYLHLLS